MSSEDRSFVWLKDAARTLELSQEELVGLLRDQTPPLPVFLDCSGDLHRSGITVWLGSRFAGGMETGMSWAMPKIAPLSPEGMVQLEARLAYGEAGLDLLVGLEVLVGYDLTPRERGFQDKDGELIEEEKIVDTYDDEGNKVDTMQKRLKSEPPAQEEQKEREQIVSA